MVMPSLIGTDTQVNSTTTGDQSGERVTALSNGTALVTWQLAGSATPLQGRIVTSSGTPTGVDLSFGSISPTSTYSVAELPNGGFVIASVTGASLKVETFSATGVAVGSQAFTITEAVSDGPRVETSSDGKIGVYLKTATSSQVGALDASLNVLVPFDALFLKNGTAEAATDADGSLWTVIDGAAIGSSNFALATTRGSGAATVIQLHIISLETFSDVSGPVTIASGAGVNVGSFKLVETAGGNFVGSWIDGTAVRAQLFQPTGTPISNLAPAGGAISINGTAPTGVSATALGDGGVLVSWSDSISGNRDIYAQVFTAAGTSASPVFIVNSDTAGTQANPSVALLGSGDVLVTWDSANGTAIDVDSRVLSFSRPDAVNDSFTTTTGVGTALALTANDTDPNGHPLSVLSVGTAAHGAVTLANGLVTYTPTAGYTGADSFTYTVTDSTGLSDTGTVSLSVVAQPSNTTPLVITPADDTNGVSVVADVSLLFPGTVARGTGAIVLTRADGAVVESFDAATSTRVALSGGRVVINPTRPLDPSTTYALSIPNGALTIGGVAYGGLTSYSFTTAAAAAATASQFALLVPSAAAATVNGTGQVFGSAGTQDVTVLNRPGTVTFDGSFNAGGDRIRLSGNANEWVVSRSGAAVTLSDGDTTVVIPAGVTGADVIFADGVRSLTADVAAGVVRLGVQDVTTTAAQVVSAAGPAVATGAVDAATASNLLVLANGRATASGTETVFGSIAGAETVTIGSGGKISLDGSFNAGGDTVVLSGAAGDYSVARSGAAVTLTSSTESVTIPVGTTGATVRFADGDRTLVLDAAAGAVKLGTQVVGTTAAGVTAGTFTTASLDQDSDGNLTTPFTIDASGSNIRFTDAVDTAHNVRLTGFGRGDSVTLTGQASTYAFSSNGTDISVSHVGSDGKLSVTTFVGIGDGTTYVNSEATAELSAGFNFVTFTV